jgi:flavin reductase (DIM6/NTAB) family NADH-FMN oxidoreductase RutF
VNDGVSLNDGVPVNGGVSVQGDLRTALSAWAAGVTLLTIADDRDDIGTTVSAFIPVSLDPPLVAVSLAAGSYPAEVLSRPSSQSSPGGATPRTPRGRPDGGASVSGPRFAITLLSSSQKVLAGQFAAEGRPSARLILDAVPHARGAASGALIPAGGLAALECSVARRVPAGDHLLVISAVEGVAYVAEAGEPLIRFRGRYPAR